MRVLWFLRFMEKRRKSEKSTRKHKQILVSKFVEKTLEDWLFFRVDVEVVRDSRHRTAPQ